MRYLYVGLIVLVVGLVFVFQLQNLEPVTVSLLTASATLPLSILVLLIYVLGMLTGGFVLAVLRTWASGARRDTDRAG